MTWKVRIIGDFDSLALSLPIEAESFVLELKGGELLMESPLFTEALTPEQVQIIALDMISLLNGSIFNVTGQKSNLEVNSVYQYDDLKRTAMYSILPSGELQFSGGLVSTKLIHPDGSIEESHPLDAVPDLLTISLSNELVANVYRILNKEVLDWRDLYNIYENIREDCKDETPLDERGWASKKKLKLFSRTVNNPGSLGIKSRHGGKSKNIPPKAPMEYSDARILILHLVREWISEKQRGVK